MKVRVRVLSIAIIIPARVLVNKKNTLSRTFRILTKMKGDIMANLYERLDALCKERGIKGARMCRDLGISKSLMTDLKSGRKKTVNADTAQKIASYFEVSVGYLLGEEDKIKNNPAGMAELHFEMIMDEDLSEIFEDFKSLNDNQRKIVKDLVRSLAENKKAEV